MKVRFSSPAHESRYWWAIIECDERFLVCARERLALPDGLVEYTVADRRDGIRGHVKDERSGVTGRAVRQMRHGCWNRRRRMG